MLWSGGYSAEIGLLDDAGKYETENLKLQSLGLVKRGGCRIES